MKLFVSIPQDTPVMETFLPSEVKAYLERRFTVEYSTLERQLTEEEFCRAVKEFDVVMTGWGHPVITGEMLTGSRVKLIAHTGGSVGSLIGEGVYESGVRVISGNLLYAESVAEGVIAYMLTGLRRIPYYVNEIKNGGWQGEQAYSEGLLDQTVGIVGLGTISKILIAMLRQFRVTVKIYSSHKIDEAFLRENNAVQTSMEEVFSTCKIVSVHSAMNEKTRGMIGKAQFDLLADGALFINTARGAVIREDEMIAALRERRFSAVLDVYCTEPLKQESELRRLENVYCMPHMAGPTIDRRPYITKKLAEAIQQFADGAEMELEIGQEAAKRMTVGG